ncbi:MAG: biotin transporter BioY [Treponema sp.]|jgi:biotin transport system substrate-specific component|nr:biotin transporter BioY [Treponema sp.]
MKDVQTTGGAKKPGPRKALLRISFTALFAALMAAGTFIVIPVGPVPVVLQNLFALLGGLVLGPAMGAAATALYLFAGLVGAPVFAGASGGVAHFAGPTGGFLVGYLLMPLVGGLIAGRPGTTEAGGESPRRFNGRLLAAVIAGFLVVYLPGIPWLKFSGGLSWPRAFTAGFLPFIAGDAAKGAAAFLIAPRLRRLAGDYLYG